MAPASLLTWARTARDRQPWPATDLTLGKQPCACPTHPGGLPHSQKASITGNGRRSLSRTRVRERKSAWSAAHDLARITKVVLERGRRVILPALLPLALFGRGHERWTRTHSQLMPPWSVLKTPSVHVNVLMRGNNAKERSRCCQWTRTSQSKRKTVHLMSRIFWEQQH